MLLHVKQVMVAQVQILLLYHVQYLLVEAVVVVDHPLRLDVVQMGEVMVELLDQQRVLLDVPILEVAAVLVVLLVVGKLLDHQEQEVQEELLQKN
tara:strand:+ start:350 stop:634 length:285 start_codon:yes stop_codon:yes gene_type:complete